MADVSEPHIGVGKTTCTEWTLASTFDCFLRLGGEPTIGLDGRVAKPDKPKPQILN